MTSNDPISVGDLVRSFEFSGRRDISGPGACYVEGRVEEVRQSVHFGRCPVYVIRVQKEIYGGEEEFDRIGIKVTTPINGTPTLRGDVCNFVERVETDDALSR